MEGLVDTLLSVPASVDGVEGYLNNLRSKTDIVVTAASSVVGHSTTLLLALKDVKIDHTTPGYALLLALQSEALPETAHGSFLVACRSFWLHANPNTINLAHTEAVKMARAMVTVALDADRPRAIIPSLQRALQLLAPSPTCLTAVHALFLQTCIKGQIYDVAVANLRANPVLEMDLKKAPLLGVDVVKYFYYAGMCYAAVNDYENALASFFQCMSIPAQSLSSVVISAVKKARLVALIHYGRDIVTSMHLPGVVVRYVKQPMAGYDTIVRAFRKGDRAALEAVLVADQDLLAKDQNTGLAYRVLASLTRHRLKRLAATFISLSLADLARRLELTDTAAAERAVLQMASSGEITARIDAATGFVRFAASDASSTTPGPAATAPSLLTPASAQLLEACLEQTFALSEKLREMQRAAITSHRYLVKNTATAARGGVGSSSSSSMLVDGPEGMLHMGMMGMGRRGVMAAERDWDMEI